MILQVAFTRVDAENRSVVWYALNLPGTDGDIFFFFYLQLLSEPGLEIWFALPLGVPEASIQTLPLPCPSCVTLLSHIFSSTPKPVPPSTFP